MKRLYTLIILISAMLFTFTSNVQATVPSVPEDDVLYGDANNDGIVNILDIITIINYIMGSNPDPFNFEAADVNNDGVVNILDVIFDINVVMETPGTPCAGFPTVLYEGQTYNTVQIGDQCWFKENLNVGTKINSTQGGFQQTNNGTIEKYCYNNDEANCDIYGGLYEWPESMQYVTTEGAQGICPVGWHIPTDDEWKILEGTGDSQYPVGDPEWDGTDGRGYDAGGKLKEAGTDHWYEPNAGASNAFAFTALPGGHREYNNGGFLYISEFGYFWSSSQLSAGSAWDRYLGVGSTKAYKTGVGKQNGFSVRCIQNTCVPTQADAGENMTICEGQTVTLADATASGYSALNWITSGTGIFNDPTLLNPIYSPSQADIESQQVQLTLNVTGAAGCADAESTIVLTINGSPETNAGPDASICISQPSFTMSGAAANYSSILWSASGTGTLNNPNLLTATYTVSTEDVAAGQVTLTLTAYGNESCEPASDAMVLTILPSPTVADAGPDQLNIDGTSTSLAGNMPVTGTGLWEIVTGTGGIIGAPANPTSGFQGIAGNSYTLNWTIASVCGSTADQVVISFADSFSCGDDLLYAGQSYSTILIGTQCWMSENLNIGTMINSTSGGQLQTDNGIIQKFCYQNNASNCDIYGGLYEWKEAMQYVTDEGSQGICPTGWHIPTNAEVKILEGTVDSQYPVGDPIWDEVGYYRGFDAGGNLKESGTLHWLEPNTGATNSSGFTGLPGGQRSSSNGAFVNITGLGNFWTSSQYDANTSFCRSLRYMNADIRLGINFKNDGYSIRCLKDTP